MPERIRRRPAGALPDGVAQDLHPVLRRVYQRRGLRDAAELDLSLRRLQPPTGMADLDRAVAALVPALSRGQRIVVVGDYDADGATATALMVLALRRLAAAAGGDPTAVQSFVPDRFSLGYGLSAAVVERLRPTEPAWLVTVDNGVSSLEGVAAAHQAGMGVVVTDHHAPGAALPAAEAVVDPLRDDDHFPSTALAGVGVAFYLALALQRGLAADGWLREEPVSLLGLLDLVAVGTVADLVPLDHNNRILVEQGLRRIRAGVARPGIVALLEQAGREPAEATAADLAFAVGPRLNAAGRMDDMTAGVECLLEEDPHRARERAVALDDLNRQRRAVESQMTEEALAGLEARAEDVGLGVCVAAEGWHQGVTGILASRLKERYHRPAVAFAPADQGMLRGSARSVPGLHIRDLLARIHGRSPKLIECFGGHAMAAGLTIESGQLDAFRREFAGALDEALGGELPELRVETDGELQPEELNLETAWALRYGGPWGQGFPEPCFDGVFRIRQSRELRGGHLRLELDADHGNGPTVPAIAFGGVERGWNQLEGPVRAIYRPEVNRFRGSVTLQLRIEYLTTAG
ncbi:MAG: single-stranded-DNA-specific exonuclease RecJ [Halorhodospira halophila]|uniref:single-stranded-DNA-specific exonuclease RecJ n=1 Tax=Halorhodospira TaxID=85108 RepID=UPI0019128424|nr:MULTISPECIES: single-stranded-DNA-specific exonuclease RecJ [Halorhodospira]MBK5937617.1 single-stranded-DNA-specific exonuclease RecJ [Halorhodospira halophila]MBK5942452.1 single-stranded-DNA-specific exonuclease RecJ [Halorhodospira halophila]MCC3750646.1 single-stranded-DNA-specific exonuclease RecJ [Halorhodospira halophila]MCG5528233.1 single-stranded-DNA-specific exonuclease RecJ [Halorhodospira halophila]MCG5532002.1 single-stranded-DNA-specific exonuclease RecJ [Halorhodospira sp. 